MARGGNEDARLQVGIKKVFILVIVERHIIGDLDPFEKNVEPSGAMEIVVFNKIENGVRVKIKSGHMVEKTEE